MKYRLRFLPEVEEDAISGYLWYESKSRGLGEDFLRIFYAGVSDLLRNPLLYPQIYKNFRRKLLRRFPYAVYFKVEDNRVIVFGLFHCARNPGMIKTNLKTRSDK